MREPLDQLPAREPLFRIGVIRRNEFDGGLVVLLSAAPRLKNRALIRPAQRRANIVAVKYG